MATTALRVLFGASLGLGMLDVAVIDLIVAPTALVGRPGPAPVPIAAPAIARAAPEPPPAPAPIEVKTPRPAPAAKRAPPRPAPVAAIAPRQIFFPTLHADLDPSAHTTLAAIAAKAGRVASITIEGHADCRGAEALNLSLRRGRAIAAREELARLGIPRDHITIRIAPPAPETTPDAQLWRDRRVDIAVDPSGGTP